MRLPIYQVDAFANHLFTGNPAAVIFPESNLSPEIMQAIAAENNLSETAFVVKVAETFHIRWFTPTIEVDLCGHATLAAAHVLFHHLGVAENKVSFASKSGILHVREEDTVLYLDFPSDHPVLVDAPADLVSGLGAKPDQVLRGRDDYLAVFRSEGEIASLAPEMSILSKVVTRGVIVSAPGDTDDFVSRFFAPQTGVPEDPVTGSAHTTLIPYWSDRLGKKRMIGRQISRRGGRLACRDLGARVEIGGRAVTYLIGEILL